MTDLLDIVAKLEKRLRAIETGAHPIRPDPRFLEGLGGGGGGGDGISLIARSDIAPVGAALYATDYQDVSIAGTSAGSYSLSTFCFLGTAADTDLSGSLPSTAGAYYDELDTDTWKVAYVFTGGDVEYMTNIVGLLGPSIVTALGSSSAFGAISANNVSTRTPASAGGGSGSANYVFNVPKTLFPEFPGSELVFVGGAGFAPE